jgi:D-xylose transport system substrate-binding protein
MPHPLAAALALLLLGTSAAAEVTVGVSWSNFQEERWKTDEAALVAELERHGARYLSADAQSSVEKQTADLESLVARGADVLIVLPQDADALVPALRAVQREGIPIVAYDRLIELPDVLYISFDNREVGRIQAREVRKRRPRGRYAFVKGSPQDPNSHFVHAGQLDVLQPAIDAGEIEVVGDQFVDGWLPELAQRVGEQMLTANDDRIDAVVCSNDAMAGGVVAALAARGLRGIPISGQDGDHAALQRIAVGSQSVSVWKDARELGRRAASAAVRLAAGATPAQIDDTESWKSGPRNVVLDAILLAPIAITRDNLDVVIDAGWIARDVVCRGVTAAAADAPAACQQP